MKSRQLLEFVSNQLPNLPHIQVELRVLADKIDNCEAIAKKLEENAKIESKPVEIYSPKKA